MPNQGLPEHLPEPPDIGAEMRFVEGTLLWGSERHAAGA
jgi:hypothetical protein